MKDKKLSNNTTCILRNNESKNIKLSQTWFIIITCKSFIDIAILEGFPPLSSLSFCAGREGGADTVEVNTGWGGGGGGGGGTLAIGGGGGGGGTLCSVLLGRAVLDEEWFELELELGEGWLGLLELELGEGWLGLLELELGELDSWESNPDSGSESST